MCYIYDMKYFIYVILHYPYQFIHWWTLRLNVLATVKSASVDMDMHLSFQISLYIFFGEILRDGTAGSYDSSYFLFFFFRNVHTIFHRLYQFTFIPAMQKISLSLHPCKQFLFVVFLITAILIGMRRYLIVLLFAFPWWLVMLNNFSCICWLFVCLLWRNVCSDPLSIFQSDCLIFFYWDIWAFYVF